MGWINNLVSFEQVNTRPRRLVLGFYHTGGKSVKVFQILNITIPSRLMQYQTTALDDTLLAVKSDPLLAKFPLHVYYAGNAPKKFNDPTIQSSPGLKKYHVVEIEMPNDHGLEDRLPAAFQRGDFLKLVKFRGFYPEQKVSLSPDMHEVFTRLDCFQANRTENETEASIIQSLLQRIDSSNSFVRNKNGEYEVNLSCQPGNVHPSGIIYTGQFLTPEEISEISKVRLDIEKPLYKKDPEKALLKERESLLVGLKRFDKVPKRDRDDLYRASVERVRQRISELEIALETDIPGLGKANLADPRLDAQISWIISDWENPCNEKGREIVELDVVDCLHEFDRGNVDGAGVVASEDELKLLTNFHSRFLRRRPLVAIAMNGAYDWTQMRMAFDEEHVKFDPLTDNVEPTRNFVRKFLQRMKQDMIYLDLLWITKTFSPWLGQRRFGTNFKLESVARSYGIEFSKILTHEELRHQEAIRLLHPDPQCRAEGRELMATYTVGDVGPLRKADDKDHVELFCWIKDAAPYLTLTDISFGTNCMHTVMDHLHFKDSRVLPFFGRNAKERQNELQIYKKRFQSWQKEKLSQSGLVLHSGFYRGVRELYIPMEEWISPLLFKIVPEFEQVYKKTSGNVKQRFAFLQYLRAFARDVLADEYFAVKERKEFNEARSSQYSHLGKYNHDSLALIQSLSNNEINSVYASFNALKDMYRSVYVPLAGVARALIRPTNDEIRSLALPEYLVDESDLYLLRAKSERIRPLLNDKDKKNLNRFCSTFATFERQCETLASKLNGVVTHPKPLVYLAVKEKRAERYSNLFFGRYHFDHQILSTRISQGYQDFADLLRRNKATSIELLGNYIFVQSKNPIPGTYEVRYLEQFPLQESQLRNKRKLDTPQLELSLT